MNREPQGIRFATTRLAQGHVGIFASVENVTYNPSLDAPSDRPFPFAYTVVVSNQSTRTVTIKARKWVIKEIVKGRCHVVEGDGIGGRFPRLEPGGTFRFNNYHVVAADSTADGSFLVCDESGQPGLVRVTAFTMTVPATS